MQLFWFLKYLGILLLPETVNVPHEEGDGGLGEHPEGEEAVDGHAGALQEVVDGAFDLVEVGVIPAVGGAEDHP